MPTLFILQGPSGGGKSTVAATLEKNYDAEICSTDDFFAETGEYKFDPRKLGEFHKRNQDKARGAMRMGKNVVIDNTNIHCWEAKPYVQAAVEFGYDVKFIRCDGGYQNLHGVPQDKVDDMRRRMESLSVEACLNAKAPWERSL